MLFGVEGLQVIDAEPGAEGTAEAWAVTDHLAAAACPDCGTVSGRVHETVLARPRDVRRGSDPVRVWWIKRRWKRQDRAVRSQDVHRVAAAGAAAVPGNRAAASAGRRRGRRARDHAGGGGPGTPGSPGRLRTRRSPPRRTRCWSRPRPWWRTWASMSTAAAVPAGGSMSRPGSTYFWRTGGTPAFLTCPAAKGCWGRPKAVPRMTPRTGWPGPPPPGGTRSRSWRPACAPSMRPRCAGCCPPRRSPSTCSTSCTWP